jgi:hypothetical protein
MRKFIKPTTFILCLGLLFTISSCSEDSTNPGGDSTASGTAEAQINGSTWTAKSSTFNNILNIDPVAGNQFILDAKDNANTRIVLSVNGDQPGSYVLDVPNTIYNAGASLQLIENGQTVIATIDKATVTITSINQDTKKASGSFSFSSDDNKYNVTSGKFKEVEFVVK